MKIEAVKISILAIICLAAIFFVVTTYVVMPLILASTVLGRVDALDSAFDPPSGTPFPPQSVVVATSDNITLSGLLFPVSTPKAWIIVLSDPHQNRSGMMPIIRWMTKNSYGVVAMDLRARGESQGNHLTGGLLEAQDLLATVRQLKPQMRGQVPTVAYGVSMGAVAALVAASQSDAIDAVIADSPYLGIQDWLRHEAERRGWLRLPGLYGAARLWAPVVTGKAVAGSNLNLTSIARSIRVPVLILKSQADPLLSGNNLAALRRAIPAPASAVTFPKGSRGTLYVLNMDAYQTALSDFLSRLSPAQETQADQAPQ